MTLSSSMTSGSGDAAKMRRPLSYVASAVALALAVASAPAALAQSAPSTSPVLQAGPVNVTFGGFTELATIYRNKSESTDVGSSFNGMPFGSSEQSNVSEFRFSARH